MQVLTGTALYHPSILRSYGLRTTWISPGVGEARLRQWESQTLPLIHASLRKMQCFTTKGLVLGDA